MIGIGLQLNWNSIEVELKQDTLELRLDWIENYRNLVGLLLQLNCNYIGISLKLRWLAIGITLE